MKKQKGSLIDFLPTMIVVLAVIIIIFVSMDFVKLLNYRLDVKAVARGYILDMETAGYLSSGDATLFKQELSNMGAKNIDLSGTTMSMVGYGNAIYLKFICEVPIEDLNMSSENLLQFFFEEISFPISVELKSTAKQ